MTRKRNWHTRLRDRGRRRIRRPLPEGMLLVELAERAGVPPRTARYYFEQRLLPPPEFRGTATRYGPEYLLRVFAIRAMQKEGLALAAIRRRLAALTRTDLERYAPEPPEQRLASDPQPEAVIEPPAATLPVVEADRDPTEGVASSAFEPPVSPPAYRAETWEHIALLPGLALLVRTDASPLIRKIAADIHAHCVGSPAPEGTADVRA